ncbi:MAG: protein kinase [Phycisphaerales bacterium]|nr:MAG: protein kinase [Phycisphaerales bacterium]
MDVCACPSEEDLARYAAGAAAPEDAAAIAAHARQCAPCARWLADDRANESVIPLVKGALARGGRPLAAGLHTGSSADAARQLAPRVPPRSDASSDSIPGYTIVRELSHGGQGVVYEATQESTRRTVAIKVLLDGRYASSQAQRRFQREIELVAGLRHPNIVTVFDSGTTSAARQYCVMDYVPGVPLGEYVRENRLSLEETLELFATICDAVDHAHQRGVIHRDLKPSNILVDAAGDPNILDFGLAKRLAPAADTAVTIAQAAIGTLQYMSPEQAGGSPEEIDTRSDVYSLGVILYELLTGRHPYLVIGPMADVLQRIIEAPPTPPSRQWTSDSGVSRRSSGRFRIDQCPIDNEVETIILKALTKERQRRYQGAGDLAEDIRRYLGGEPIKAKRDSVAYVLGKRIRRNRLAVGLSLALFVVATASLIGTLKFFTGTDSATGTGSAVRADEVVNYHEDRVFDGDFELGDSGTTLAQLAIDAQHTLTVGNRFTIGASAAAKVTVSEGAHVDTHETYIATQDSIRGQVTVSGAGSTWNAAQFLVVGEEGIGELTVQDAASVLCQKGYIGLMTGADGTTNIHGDGTHLVCWDSLRIGGSTTHNGGTGTLNVYGGIVDVSNALCLWPGGTVNLTGGMIRAQWLVWDFTEEAPGVFNFDGGTLGVETVAGSLANSRGTLSPTAAGGDTTIQGSYTQGRNGTLLIQISGVGSTDWLDVKETARIDGWLEVHLIDAFEPEFTDHFVIITAGTLHGKFFNSPAGHVVVPEGGRFTVEYDTAANRVELNSYESYERLEAFPLEIAQSTTGSCELRYIGPPDDCFGVLHAGQHVVYDFLDQRIYDGPGPDLTVYEADWDYIEFDKVVVSVSADGKAFRDITLSESPVVRIPGDEDHRDDNFARSYDLKAVGLGEARYVRIACVAAHGFDLDAIGAIHWTRELPSAD